MVTLAVEKHDDHNPLEICDLRVSPICTQGVDLLAELQIGVSEINLADSLYRVGVMSATLSLALDGLKTKLGSKVGAFNSVAAELQSSHQREYRNRQAATIQGMLNPRKPSIDSSLAASAEKASTENFQAKSSIGHSGIRAQTSDRWKIEDPRGRETPLDTTILNGARLCTLEAKPKANRHSCQVTVYAAPAEFVVTQKVGGRRASNVNRERILGVIATRSISGEQRFTSATSLGIILSRSEVDFEITDE